MLLPFGAIVRSSSTAGRLLRSQPSRIGCFSISGTRGTFSSNAFEFKKPATHKEVNDRLMKVLYKNDVRKDYLHDKNSDLHYVLGIHPGQIDDLLDSIEHEFGIHMHMGHFNTLRKVSDLHAFICQQLDIPATEIRTIQQRKAAAKAQLLQQQQQQQLLKEAEQLLKKAEKTTNKLGQQKTTTDG